MMLAHNHQVELSRKLYYPFTFRQNGVDIYQPTFQPTTQPNRLAYRPSPLFNPYLPRPTYQPGHTGREAHLGILLSPGKRNSSYPPPQSHQTEQNCKGHPYPTTTPHLKQPQHFTSHEPSQSITQTKPGPKESKKALTGYRKGTQSSRWLQEVAVDMHQIHHQNNWMKHA